MPGPLNAEIRYYSKQLKLNKRDLTQSWKILKTIIGNGINKTAGKSASASMAISCTVSPMSYIDIR